MIQKKNDEIYNPLNSSRVKYSYNNSNNIAADIRKEPMVCHETMGHTNKLRGFGS